MLKLFVLYSRENRTSINALAAAMETLPVPGLKAVFPGTSRDLLAALREDSGEAGPRVAAISFFTCQAASTAALIKKLKKESPGTILVAGGPHPSADPEGTLTMGFDYAVAGEGEDVFPCLLRSIAAGKPPAQGIIRGRRTDLSAFPAFSARHGLFGPIEITRGCPYACSYCQTSFLFGTRPRHRPLPGILSAMELKFSRGLRDMRFITPDAFAYGSADGRQLNLPALEEFMRETSGLAAKRGGRIFVGSFPSEVRPDHITPETLRLVKKYAYNRRLVIGAQSASPRALKAIRRGHGRESIFDAVRLCREHKLFPYLDFIFGLPGETAEDEEASIDALEQLSAMGAMIHTHAFMPLPGTPLAGARPKPFSPRMRGFIERLESRGKAFGKWRAQLSFARKRID